jgi:putative endonuclease
VSRHYVYLARAADGAYYCGYALDPVKRVAAHNAGRGAKILRGRRPVTLSYAKRFSTKTDALRYEIALKKRTHEYKSTLSGRWLAKKGRR